MSSEPQATGSVTVASPIASSTTQLPSASVVAARPHSFKWAAIAGAAVVVVLALAGWLYFARRARALTNRDTVVLSDFENKTGDAVFDDTLRQGLSVQLEQSPFLSMISESKVNQTLKLMDRPAGDHLTPEVTREVCQRIGSKAMLTGSIAGRGSQYVVGLKAVNCQSGDLLAEAQEQATSKEGVLKALDAAAVRLRSKLGESLSTVQEYATPLEDATTSSLEALKAFSQGRKANAAGLETGRTFFHEAIRLDPNFAMAYAALAVNDSNVGETSLAAENARKTYELRDHVSEREKFYIESQYYMLATGDLEKSLQVLLLLKQTYPRDARAPRNLTVIYEGLGQYDNALAETREAFRLDPGSGLNYANLVSSYLALNRLDEARNAAEQALKKNFDSIDLRWNLYFLGFAMNDAAYMAQQTAWLADHPNGQPAADVSAADTAAYSGRLKKARELSRQAADGVQHFQLKELAAGVEAGAALREALFGNAREARERAAVALQLSRGRDVEFAVACALAFAGDAARAQALAKDLDRRFPEDTLVQFNYLPTLDAQATLNTSDASRSVEALRKAIRFELGSAPFAFFSTTLYPVYVRGAAFLALHHGNEAGVEFQKILDHRGLVLNEPIGALTHLQLARSHAMQGDTVKAKAAYQDFLTLWKDADPDIPVLKEAKAEYAKLH